MDERDTAVSGCALPTGQDLHGYRVVGVLGENAFGITYLAHDRKLDRAVALTEYLPRGVGGRTGDALVAASTDAREKRFEWGIARFLDDSHILARLEHPHVVRVHGSFEANGTAYRVMAHEPGESLDRIYRRGEPLSQSFLEGVFLPVLDGLNAIHAVGLLHGDIKPSNLCVRGSGQPVLLGFGVTTVDSVHGGAATSHASMSDGYSPPEQYDEEYGRPGQWTDHYALAASLYEGVAGRRPVAAPDRSTARFHARTDPLIPLAKLAPAGFDRPFLEAVDAALLLEPERRPASAAAWLDRFDRGGRGRGRATDRDDDRVGMPTGSEPPDAEHTDTVQTDTVPTDVESPRERAVHSEAPRRVRGRRHDRSAQPSDAGHRLDASIDDEFGSSLAAPDEDRRAEPPSFRRAGRRRSSAGSTASLRAARVPASLDDPDDDPVLETDELPDPAPDRYDQVRLIEAVPDGERDGHGGTPPHDADPDGLLVDEAAATVADPVTADTRASSAPARGTADGPAFRGAAGTIPPSRRRRPVVRTMLGVCLVAALAVALWLAMPRTSAPPPDIAIDGATLAALPTPTEPVELHLPQDAVVSRLERLADLAAAYDRAETSVPNDVQRGAAELTGELRDYAARWHASRYPAVADGVRRVLERLPIERSERVRIERLLRPDAENVSTARLLERIASGDVLRPAGDSVLDLAPGLNARQWRDVSTTEGWADLEVRLKAAAVESVNEEAFDSAARVLEAALAMDPDNDEFATLATHLDAAVGER